MKEAYEDFLSEYSRPSFGQAQSSSRTVGVIQKVANDVHLMSTTDEFVFCLGYWALVVGAGCLFY